MKFYIASKLENHAAVSALRAELVKLGHCVTYDWTVHGPVYRSGLARVAAVAVDEVRGVLDADFVVVLWPGGRGTHVELGMAIAAGKPTVFVSDHEPHHEATTETCAFYHHPLVRRFRTVEEAMIWFRVGASAAPAA